MPKLFKGETIKLRPMAGDNETLKEIAQVTGLDQIQISSMLLHAGLEAVKRAGYRMLFPVILSVDDAASRKAVEDALTSTSGHPATRSLAAEAAAKLTGAAEGKKQTGKKDRFER